MILRGERRLTSFEEGVASGNIDANRMKQTKCRRKVPACEEVIA
jgi:hypothetical protein